MSVLKRNRSESQLEFYHTATMIYSDLAHLMMNTKIIPKRWRPVFAFPVMEYADRLIDNITAANTIYPQNLHEAEIRRDYQYAAIITVEQIFQRLQRILVTLKINPDKFQPVTELLVKESALLRGWRKADYKFITKFQK